MKTTLAVVVFVTATLGGHDASGVLPEGSGTSREPELYLCSALEKVRAGERLPVLVSGILVSGYENTVFFDPAQTSCREDVQPSTWVEFKPVAGEHAKLYRLLETSHRAKVTIRGELFGPPPVGPDDFTLSPPLAYANRTAGRRYGHLGAFRTKLVVQEILEVDPATGDLATLAPTFHRRETSGGLRVMGGSLPQYPELAWRAGISGDVSIRVVVKAGEVVSTELLSGDRLLEGGATATIKTWRFGDGVDAAFTTTFVYRLERQLSGAGGGEHVEMQLPWLVRITAPSNDW